MRYSTDNSKDLPRLVYKLLFDGAEIFYKDKQLQLGKVRLRSGRGTLKKVKVGDYVYLEQNPHTASRWGALARCNHNIMWIIHDPSGKYIGRVVDGKVTQL